VADVEKLVARLGAKAKSEKPRRDRVKREKDAEAKAADDDIDVPGPLVSLGRRALRGGMRALYERVLETDIYGKPPPFGGYIVAVAPPVRRVIDVLARFPKSPKVAVAYVACLAMFASLLSWGFSMIFAGILMREISKRVNGVDYRAMGAAGYLGLGSVWALGLSSSAALRTISRTAGMS